MGTSKSTKALCPQCGHDEYTVAGVMGNTAKTTRYRCKACQRRFNDNTAIYNVKDAKIHNGGKSIKVVKPATLKQLSNEEKQRREIKGLKSQVKDLTSEAIDTTRLRTLIHGMANTPSTPPTWLVKHSKGCNSFGTPTLFLSDLHWGEHVYPEQINGINSYNLPVARARLKRTFTQTVRLLRDYLADGAYEGIVVALGGDMMSGNIHEELRETNDAHILACVADLHDHMVAGLEMMADEFGRVFVPCVVGNHGRLDKKPRAKGAVRDNFEWILYHYIQKHFANDDRVTVIISESLDYVYKVHNHTYLLTHGDQFRGGSGIAGPMTPWALGDHRKRKRQDAIKQPFDTMIFGHWHQLFWGNGSFICNGSLKGYDEYAFRSNFSVQEAMQALWITHPEHGITFQMPVLADESPACETRNWVSVIGK